MVYRETVMFCLSVLVAIQVLTGLVLLNVGVEMAKHKAMANSAVPTTELQHRGIPPEPVKPSVKPISSSSGSDDLNRKLPTESKSKMEVEIEEAIEDFEDDFTTESNHSLDIETTHNFEQQGRSIPSSGIGRDHIRSQNHLQSNSKASIPESAEEVSIPGLGFGEEQAPPDAVFMTYGYYPNGHLTLMLPRNYRLRSSQINFKDPDLVVKMLNKVALAIDPDGLVRTHLRGIVWFREMELLKLMAEPPFLKKNKWAYRIRRPKYTPAPELM